MHGPQDYQCYAGIDWATQTHQVCVIDPAGRDSEQRAVAHSSQGLADLVDWLVTRAGGVPSGVAVAIEMPRGAVVETLVERGVHVYALNPKQLDRFRDRHTIAGAKDDRLDAFVLADSLRTDAALFRRLALEDPLVLQIREGSRLDDELREELSRLTNRLREQVYRVLPSLLTLSPAANEPWLWALLRLAPTPAKARALRVTRLVTLLKDHRIRRVTAEELWAKLAEPAPYVAPGTTEAVAAHIALLLPRVRLVHAQRITCQDQLQRLLDQLTPEPNAEGQPNEHRDVDIIRSLPGVGIRTVATMLGEAHEALRTHDYTALRAHGGIAPVTRRSGTRKLVLMRRACNGRLRNALYNAARVSLTCDPRHKAIYAALRARGHSHGRALRSVSDHMLRILMAMLATNTLYNPLHPVRGPQPAKSAA